MVGWRQKGLAAPPRATGGGCGRKAAKIKFLFVSVFAVPLLSSAQLLENGDAVPAADPALIFSDGSYYVFSTGVGAPIYRSDDLIRWKPAGHVFDKGFPAWLAGELPESSASVWAPDAVKVGDEYRVYWSTSTLGSQNSVIGLAVNRTLDPDSPDYRWEDRGMVIRTTKGDDWNAIDPQCFIDRQGKAWLLMGSYWSGIRMYRLDKDGSLSKADKVVYPLARRTGKDVSLEGGYIIRRKGFYYLFVSFGKTASWGMHNTYDVRVGRAVEVAGPYVDMDGTPLMKGGGTLVLKGHGNICGPGHCSVLQDNGRTWLAHHYFDPERGMSRLLQIRPMFWSRSGWPVAGEPVKANEKKFGSPSGEWAYSVDYAEPLTVALNEDHSIGTPGTIGGTWNLADGILHLTFEWIPSNYGGGKTYRYKAGYFYDPDGHWFVGRNQYGQIMKGKRFFPGR